MFGEEELEEEKEYREFSVICASPKAELLVFKSHDYINFIEGNIGSQVFLKG